jgi:outer membrane receptor protein involved in Fe transport
VAVLAAMVVPGSARAEDPPGQAADAVPRRAEQVVVTATREESRVADAPASVAVLSSAVLEATAAPTVDDALRQVAGFSLFRRSGSRFANPTSQGLSLRGLSASGASRALVLVDGVPQNDPFGGWVYWSRLPRESVERLEVQRGGASDLYGSSALGGVVQVVTRPSGAGPRVEGEASAGGLGTFDASGSARVVRGEWGARLSAQAFRTGGYVPVDETDRGPVDTEASSRHVGSELLVERQHGAGRVFVHASAFGEARENGTPLQTNDTRIFAGSAGVDSGAVGGARWSARAWGQGQVYKQAFSAIAADRTREDLTRQQRVPAGALGASAQHARSLGARHRLLAGVEGSWVDGTTEETVFVRGAATNRVDAGGTALAAAAFVQDLWQPHPRLFATGSLRLDGWWLRNGQSTATPLNGGATVSTAYGDRGESALSPRFGLLFRASSAVSIVGSVYGAFRAPTLNELYRSFRLGDTLTLANPQLGPERLRGGEAGVRLARGPAALRLTAFDSNLHDAVANVTVTTAPGLVTRQRQNVARVRARGLEAEAELALGQHAFASAGYAFTDSRVLSFPGEPALEGRSVVQVPRHQLTFQARHEGAWRLGLQLRYTGEAWDDDRNTLLLDPAWQLDARAGRLVGGGVELFVAGENLLDAEIVTALTPVPSLAPGSCAPVARGRSDGSGTEGGRNRKRTTNGADHSFGLSRNLANDPG